MSDIGLAGVSTTSLNKVGPSGETLPGSAFGGLDAFGGSGPQVGINDVRRRAKKTAEDELDELLAMMGGSYDGGRGAM